MEGGHDTHGFKYHRWLFVGVLLCQAISQTGLQNNTDLRRSSDMSLFLLIAGRQEAVSRPGQFAARHLLKKVRSTFTVILCFAENLDLFAICANCEDRVSDCRQARTRALLPAGYRTGREGDVDEKEQYEDDVEVRMSRYNSLDLRAVQEQAATNLIQSWSLLDHANSDCVVADFKRKRKHSQQ